MADVTWESKLRSVVRSSMPLWPRNWVAIRHAVLHYARVAMRLVRELNVSTVVHLCSLDANPLNALAT